MPPPERGRWSSGDCLHNGHHLRGDSFGHDVEKRLRWNGLIDVVVHVTLEELDRPWDDARSHDA